MARSVRCFYNQQIQVAVHARVSPSATSKEDDPVRVHSLDETAYDFSESSFVHSNLVHALILTRHHYDSATNLQNGSATLK